MSAFYRVESERDALEDRVEELERENRLLRKQYDRRVEERDDLMAGMKSLLALFSEPWGAARMVKVAREAVELWVAKEGA